MSDFDGWYGPQGTGSGVGSGVAYTAGYRAFLEAFMAQHDVRSVLDVGCGDWEFSRLVEWGERLYVGQDVVASLVERLRAEHGWFMRRFVTEIPDRSFDLVLCKDVLIHLPNVEAVAIVATLRQRGRHVLLVNDYERGPNADCERGSYRPLDLSAPPFSLETERLYTFPRLNNEHKVVEHVRGAL